MRRCSISARGPRAVSAAQASISSWVDRFCGPRIGAVPAASRCNSATIAQQEVPDQSADQPWRIGVCTRRPTGIEQPHKSREHTLAFRLLGRAIELLERGHGIRLGPHRRSRQALLPTRGDNPRIPHDLPDNGGDAGGPSLFPGRPLVCFNLIESRRFTALEVPQPGEQVDASRVDRLRLLETDVCHHPDQMRKPRCLFKSPGAAALCKSLSITAQDRFRPAASSRRRAISSRLFFRESFQQ